MQKSLKALLLTLAITLGLGVSACKKAEEATAESAQEVITEVKENTIDAANEAAAATEMAAKASAEAAEQAVTESKMTAEDAVKAAKEAAAAQ